VRLCHPDGQLRLRAHPPPDARAALDANGVQPSDALHFADDATSIGTPRWCNVRRWSEVRWGEEVRWCEEVMWGGEARWGDVMWCDVMWCDVMWGVEDTEQNGVEHKTIRFECVEKKTN
jgi:hypothetical protein